MILIFCFTLVKSLKNILVVLVWKGLIESIHFCFTFQKVFCIFLLPFKSSNFFNSIYILVILTSYAKERRFLHPPPTVTFFGGGWGLNPKAQFPTNQRTDSSFPVTVSATPLINDGSRNETMIGRTSVSAARLDGISSTTSVRDEVSRDIVGISRAPRIVAQSVFSKLHMNKGKYFSLRMQVHNSSDQEILQVESDVIKIISKPPRSNASDFNIKSGSTVALFNRLNAQTKTTKYLACSGNKQY